MVIVINLARATARYAKWLGVPGVQRLEAVDGKALLADPVGALRTHPFISVAQLHAVLGKAPRMYHIDMNMPGEVGCYLSHLAALRAVMEAPAHIEAAFVIEDDFCPWQTLLQGAPRPLTATSLAQALLGTVASQPWASEAMRINAGILCPFKSPGVRFKRGTPSAAAPQGAVSFFMGNSVNWYPRGMAQDTHAAMLPLMGQFDLAMGVASKNGRLDVRAAAPATAIPHNSVEGTGSIMDAIHNSPLCTQLMHLPWSTWGVVFLGTGSTLLLGLMVAVIVLAARIRRARTSEAGGGGALRVGRGPRAALTS